LDTLKAEKQKAAAEEAVFPAIIKILKEHVYNTRDPIIVGVEIVEGSNITLSRYLATILIFQF